MDVVQVSRWHVPHSTDVEMLNSASCNWVGVGKSVISEQNEVLLA